jgi:hypothetical protein
MARSHRSSAWAIAAPALLLVTPHNSEEHKLIADRGAAQVVIPASVKLPAGLGFVAPEAAAASANVWLTVSGGTLSSTGWVVLNWKRPNNAGKYDFVALYESNAKPTNTDGYLANQWQWASKGTSHTTWTKYDPAKSYWIAYLKVDGSKKGLLDANCDKCPRTFLWREKLVTETVDDTKLGDYLARFKRAKRLAVGYDTSGQYDRKSICQDNCYWHGYGQLEDFNKKLWIPKQELAPEKCLMIPTRVANTSYGFTFGELVAFYGDYRRTVYAKDGECYLTPNDTHASVSFPGNNLQGEKFCPQDIPLVRYLHSIASGLVPPYGKKGNNFWNSVSSETYDGSAGWWGDEMMRIANVNDWHFANAAVAWYAGMHRLALRYAHEAQVTGDPKHWNHALHYEANALHTLTDLFAYGHVVCHGDVTSFETMQKASLTDAPRYKWMEDILRLGGGTRDAAGLVSIKGVGLPPIPSAADVAQREARDDALKSYRSTTDVELGLEKYQEHEDHDNFNDEGAIVRNLLGSEFRIYGDFGLQKLEDDDREMASTAVKVSLQKLFDAAVALQNGTKTVEQLGDSGSEYFEALKYVPVFVVDGRFKGRWTRYAKAIDDLTGAGVVPETWAACQLPRLTGRRKEGGLAAAPLPAAEGSACSTFPDVQPNRRR